MFDHFIKEKSDFLKKRDKSKRGYVDEDIKEIVSVINSKKDYYTTSSCAGRIVLLEMKSKRKDECDWIFSKHNEIKLNEIKNPLKKYKQKNKINQIWFKQQPIILHIACRNIQAAKKLLDAARKIFRRVGIIGITKRKVMVEIIGDEKLDTIIADKDFAADENYIKKLIKYANENFIENQRKSEMFLGIIKKEL